MLARDASRSAKSTTMRKDGRGTIHDCRLVFDEPQDGVFASDHFGVLAEVQIPAGAG